MCATAYRTIKPSVGAGFYPARGRGRAPPLRTARYTSVGADAPVRPPELHRPPCKTPCHCEASSQTGRGERTERCQWQKKRGERVAAVKISSVRRKAAQKFWAPQQGHPHPPSSRPPCLKGTGTAKPCLGDSSPHRTSCNAFVGAGFYPARSSASLVTDAGRCGHRPLRNPIGKPSVGADAYIGPLPGLHKFPCHP